MIGSELAVSCLSAPIWMKARWLIGVSPDVLAEHSHTIKVQHTLCPFAVAMAGSGEFDPFKD
jgi:hypothetical protein